MSNVAVVKPQNTVDVESLQRVLLGGDLSTLKPEQKIQYYNHVCELTGLNPLTKPFDYIRLNGKEVLYANKGCAEQLRQVHKISIRVTNREKIEDVYIVTVEAANAVGRVDSSTGAVTIAGLKGDFLANAMMKAETKAKRRVTLSICGLNMLDETEVETIPEATKPGSLQAWDATPPEHEKTEYRIDFGKFNMRSLEEVGPSKLRDYVLYLEGSVNKPGGKPLSAKALEFIKQAEAYIGAFENSDIPV